MRKVFFVVMLVVFGVTEGCVLLPKTAVMTEPEEEYQNAAALVKEKKYSEALALYREIAVDSPQSAVAADALFEAAYLQVFYDNPQKDYSQALSGFDEFLKRYPDHARAKDARNWRVALKAIVDAKKENEHLLKNIEELKKLDIRHEERRSK